SAVSTIQIAEYQYFRSNAAAMIHTAVAVDMDRGFTYWSMMYSAVPATGIVSSAATRSEPPHAARSLRKQIRLIFQHPQSKRKMQPKCQASSVHSSDRWLNRFDHAIRFG